MDPKTNIDRLIREGLLDKAMLGSEDLKHINALSGEEIDAIISAGARIKGPPQSRDKRIAFSV